MYVLLFLDKENPMTEAQQRRQELLNQTRKLYSDKGTVPAVHPRYGNFGINSNNSKIEENEKISSFRMRVIAAILLFLIYAGLDYSGSTLMEFTSEDIVNVVSNHIDVVAVWNQL